MTTRNHKRALRALRALRARHSKQAQQIDILCGDIVSAHQEFSQKLSRLYFAASFYETLLAANDRESLLEMAIGAIRTEIEEAGAAVFLLGDTGFDVFLADADVPAESAPATFEHWFTRSLVDHISRTNRICSLDQLLRMGMQGPPAILKTLSAAAVPLGRFGQGMGFILIYRHAARPLSAEELARVAGVTSGLRDALDRFTPAPEHLKTAR